MGWPFVFQLLISVAFAVAAYYLAPKPRGLGEKSGLRIPGVQEGEPIPYLFGRFSTKGTIIYPRNRDEVELSTRGGGTKPTKYRATFAILYGWGPLHSVSELMIDDYAVWQAEPALEYDPDDFPNGFASLDTSRGPVRLYWGDPATQAGSVDAKLIELLQTADLPDYRHLVYAVFEQFDLKESPTIPNLTLRGMRWPQTAGLLNQDLVATGDGANPVHVLAELYTNPYFGAGLDWAEFDSAAMDAAALTVSTEGRGIGGTIESLVSLEEFTQEVLYHIDGGLVWTGGLWTINLLRRSLDAYEIAELDITNMTRQAGLVQNTVNHILVEFTDRHAQWTTGTLPVYDVASVLAGDNTRRETLRLPLFTQRDTATNVAATKLQELTTPHDAVEFECPRRAGYPLRWGDLIKLTYQPFGYTPGMLWRVIGIERDPVNPGRAKVKAVHELGQVSHFLPPTGEPEPPIPPGDGGGGAGGSSKLKIALRRHLPIECPLVFNPAADVRISYLAAREHHSYNKFLLMGAALAGLPLDEYRDECPFLFAGTLAAALPTGPLTNDAGFNIESPVLELDVDEFVATGSVTRDELWIPRRLGLIVPGDLAADRTNAVYHEWIAFQTIATVSTSPKVYHLGGVLRGRYDTQALSHAAGAWLFILPTIELPFTLQRADFAPGATLTLQPLPYAGSAIAPPLAHPSDALLLRDRAACPYPPGNAAVDGNGYDPTYVDGATPRLTWLSRRRNGGHELQNESGDVDDFVVRLLDGTTGDQVGADLTVPLANTVVDAHGATRHYLDLAPPGGLASMICRVYSRDGSLESIQPAEIEMENVTP